MNLIRPWTAGAISKLEGMTGDAQTALIDQLGRVQTFMRQFDISEANEVKLTLQERLAHLKKDSAVQSLYRTAQELEPSSSVKQVQHALDIYKQCSNNHSAQMIETLAKVFPAVLGILANQVEKLSHDHTPCCDLLLELCKEPLLHDRFGGAAPMSSSAGLFIALASDGTQLALRFRELKDAIDSGDLCGTKDNLLANVSTMYWRVFSEWPQRYTPKKAAPIVEKWFSVLRATVERRRESMLTLITAGADATIARDSVALEAAAAALAEIAGGGLAPRQAWHHEWKHGGNVLTFASEKTASVRAEAIEKQMRDTVQANFAAPRGQGDKHKLVLVLSLCRVA